MKKIYKIMGVILTVVLLTGCFGSMTPSEKTEDFLNKYIKSDEKIMKELDTYINKQDLTDKQKERYKTIIKDEYSNILYDIKNETIDGEKATVEVSIKLKDLHKPNKEAESYLKEHATEFYTGEIYDPAKFVDYKLERMEKSSDTISYTIYINLNKVDDVWTIEDLDDATLEKIHGIYDYESE